MNDSISKALFQGASRMIQKSTDLSDWEGRDITPRDHSFWNAFYGRSNISGKIVSERSVLQLSAAMACVRLISETLSTLPVGVYESQNKTGVSQLAADHKLNNIVSTSPNANMSPTVFWQSVVASLLLRGNSYCEKQYLGDKLVSLDFLIPNFVTWEKVRGNQRLWHYNDPVTGRTRDIPADRMWHIPAFTTDGIDGLSPIAYGANVFGTTMATEEASADTFKRAMKSPGLVTMDSLLSPEQRTDIRQHVKEVADSGQFMVLEKGSAFHPLSMNPVDAELLASRGFNIEEICRWYRVQPALIGHGGKDSNWGTGLEEKMTWLVTLTLRPWAKRIEDAARKDLLLPAERSRFSLKFGLEGLLRGDSEARAKFYASMTANGIYTRDYCRQLENLPPMGGNAAVLTVQSAMLPIDMLGQMLKAATAPDGSPEKEGAKFLLALLERNQQ